MLDGLSRLPQMVFIVILLVSLAFLSSFGLGLEYVGADMMNMPIGQLPADYWYVLVIVLVALPAAVVSTYLLGWAKGQTPSSILASMGVLFLGYFLFNIDGGWRGGTLLAATGAGLFFSLAVVFHMLEYQRKPTQSTSPDNPETS
jgi:hypothetical protein